MRVIMIRVPRFKNRQTERLFNREHDPRFPPDIAERAHTRLRRVVAANVLNDLLVPPSLRLEALSGRRKGTWSIRINRQWRVCFRWTDAGATDIEVVDYH